ncbi:hypothetical protein M5689_014641 [Euphorbia peplus]|nr:hypothetical protein M5689_014641 [Euphorbia peplus]
MKSVKHAHIRLYHHSKPISSASPPLLEHFYATKQPQIPSFSTPKSTHHQEQEQELIKINLLIPRLCLSGHLTTAIHLTTTPLLYSNPPPPPTSISFSILIHSLTSQPDMAKCMSLLTILRHNPQAHPCLTSITTLLITSYVKKKRPKEALKVYQWTLRPGSPCKVEKRGYEVMVIGFCDLGLKFEALRVLRDMVHVGFVPGGGLRSRVYRSLLMDARVIEAVDFNRVLGSCSRDFDAEKLLELLDSMIRSWAN